VWENAAIANSRVFPYFIMIQTIFAFLIWAGFALKDSSDPAKSEGKEWTSMLAGLESLFPGQTALATHVQCEYDLRAEIWRWFTYQWSHVGIEHIGFNCILNLVLGWRLEKLHGNLRMGLFYNIGVFGGACCYFISDAHISVVGMSGGCYSLFGMHWGYWVINFKQKRYRWLTFFVLALFMTVDIVTYFETYKAEEAGGAKVSHSAHAGGFIAGFLLVIMFGENLVVTPFEDNLKKCSLVLAIVLTAGCLGFRVVNWAPWTIWSTEPWCFTQLVYNRTFFGDSKWHCIRCGTKACEMAWSQPAQLWTSAATYYECNTKWDGFSPLQTNIDM